MFRWVYVHQNESRDIKTLTANLNEGLQGLNFFGYFFIFGGLLFLFIAIFKIRIFAPYIMIIAVLIIGYLMINKSKKRLEIRKDCFVNGQAIEGTVVRQGRSSNFFSSTSNYSIIVSVDNKNIEVIHKSKSLWDSCPIGDSIIGFRHNGNYFFGPEIGCIFKYFK